MAPVIRSWIICGDFDKGKHLKKIKQKLNVKNVRRRWRKL